MVDVMISGLRASYAGREVVKGIDLKVPKNTIVGVIGPAGAGKTTMLTCLNRTIELQSKSVWSGSVTVDGADVRTIDPSDLRRRVAMVLPLPVGLPMSIYDNVAFAPRMVGLRNKADLDVLVEQCLTRAALWDEVKDRLDMLGTRLSGGQQQRLTLARALSTEPDVLCLDEFSIAIDPVTTMRIEAVLVELKQKMTIIMVTNLLQQARRVADTTAFVLGGQVVETGPTDQLFDRPSDTRTADYVSGKFG